MKSEHRHELKTNELAQWISNLPQWARENRRTIIYVSVVAVAVIVLAPWYWYSKNVESVKKQLELTKLIAQLPQGKAQIIQAQAKGVDISYLLIQIADNLHAAAQNTKDDTAAALALIKQAESLRTELHYRLGTLSQQDITTQINQARDNYTAAMEKSANNPSLTAAAQLGIGLCEEELGNFDKARQIYLDITKNDSLECTTAAAIAKQRFETMADYQQKIVFRAPPKPEPVETVEPQVQLANSPDFNMAVPTLNNTPGDTVPNQ